MNKKVIIFDMDGVLFDSVELMHQDALARYPSISLEMIKDLHKGNIFEEIEKIKHLKKEESLEEENLRKETYTKNKASVSMYEGMKEILEELSKENILTINSSASLQNCLPLLEKEKVVGLFSFIATKETHTSKVEKFNIIAQKFNKNIDEVIFITDTVGDIKEAHKVSAPTIMVTWGVHNENDFNREDYDNIISIVKTPEELGILLVSI